jgi:hypothetical protein
VHRRHIRRLPLAYAARSHSLRVGQERSPDIATDRREALRLAEAAIARDGNDALAWAVYGHQKAFLTNAAMESFDRAIAANPNLALAWTYLSASALRFSVSVSKSPRRWRMINTPTQLSAAGAGGAGRSNRRTRRAGLRNFSPPLSAVEQSGDRPQHPMNKAG